jgi:hypothetical protein
MGGRAPVELCGRRLLYQASAWGAQIRSSCKSGYSSARRSLCTPRAIVQHFAPVTSDTWPRRLVMAAAIAGAAVLGGCGAGGPDVPAFDREANRICSTLTHRLAALPRPPSNPGTLARKDEVGLKARRRLDVYARGVNRYVEQTLRSSAI